MNSENETTNTESGGVISVEPKKTWFYTLQIGKDFYCHLRTCAMCRKHLKKRIGDEIDYTALNEHECASKNRFDQRLDTLIS